MTDFVHTIRNSHFLAKLVHTLDYCLEKELSDCSEVLDLGCGPSSPIQKCKNIKYSLGVEVFTPYLEEAKKLAIHTEYLSVNILELEFPENSFDAVIMIEVLEHLPYQEGLKILQKSFRWAKKKVILSTPNGYFPMGSVDQNDFQRHLSGWTVDELKRQGFVSYGMSGAKALYVSENTVHSLLTCQNLYDNIRFRPKLFFYFLNAVLQIFFCYYLPQFAFGLFAVKKKKRCHISFCFFWEIFIHIF